ncbi:MAG: hypothetical protein QXW79_04090 [Thermoplasmata archaeon]
MYIIKNPFFGSVDDRVIAINPLSVIYKIKNEYFPKNNADVTYAITLYEINPDDFTLEVTLIGSPAISINDLVKITGTLVDGMYRVIAILSPTKFKLNYSSTNLVSGTSGGLQIQRTNFRTILEVYSGLPSEHYLHNKNPIKKICRLSATPNFENIAFFDVGAPVRSTILPILNDYNHSDLIDYKLFTCFYVQVKESYTVFDGNGHANTYESNVLETSLTCYGLHAFFQPRQNEYKNNLLEYVIKQNGRLAKFLTCFEEMYHFENYQFDVFVFLDRSFVVANNNQTLELEIEQYDKENQLISINYVDVITLKSTAGQMNYGLLRIKLDEIGLLYDCYYYTIQLQINFQYVSEKKKIFYKKDDVCKHVYLRWLNELGVFDGWRFDGNREEELEISERKVFTNEIDFLIEDWAYVEAERRLQEVKSEKIYRVRSSFLTKEQVKCIVRILESPVVYIFEKADMQIRLTHDDYRIVDSGDYRILNLGNQLYFYKQILIDKDSFIYYKDNQNFYTIEFSYRDTFLRRNQIQ